MDASLLVSVGSALVAMFAVLLSVRQTRQQNLLPVVFDAFREARTTDWFDARDWVMTRLAAEHRPDRGVSGLPEPARERVRGSSSFLDNLGVFVAYKVVDEDLANGLFGVGMNELWIVLEPYILREREIRKTGYLVFYEDLVCRFRSRPPGEVYSELGLRQLTSGG